MRRLPATPKDSNHEDTAIRSLVLFVLLGSAIPLPAATADSRSGDWPQWRGPDRSNVSRETGLQQSWPPGGPPLRWITTGLGEGITAVAVVHGVAYTLGYRDGAEFLHAIQTGDGRGHWSTPVGTEADRRLVPGNSVMRWLSPRVPTVDGDRVYTVSAGGTLTCVITNAGEIRWQVSYPQRFLSPPRIWGFCDYPLVDGNRLICTPAGPGAYFAALDKHSGAVLWKTILQPDEPAGHGALIAAEFGGIRQYVASLGRSLVGIAADDGRLLWRESRLSFRTASSYTPIVHDDWIAVPNGYGAGLAAFRVARDASGFTLTPQYHERLRFNPFQDSTALVGEHLYVTEEAGVVACVELRSGRRVWTLDSAENRRRAALTYADGHLYIRRSDGSMTLIEASPQGHRTTGSFTIPDFQESQGVTFPVVARGHLYLRDNDRLLCYDIRSEAPPGAGATPVAPIALKPQAVPTAALAREHRTGTNRPPDAIFVPTPSDIVDLMLDMAGLREDQVLYDLGSGDGRFLIAAARKYGCKAVGLELDPQLVNQSRETVKNLGLESRVRIEHADFFTTDVSGADVIVAYLPTTLLDRLMPQFRTLKTGARILSHQFPISGVRPIRTESVVSTEDGDRHVVRLWVAPLPEASPPPP